MSLITKKKRPEFGGSIHNEKANTRFKTLKGSKGVEAARSSSTPASRGELKKKKEGKLGIDQPWEGKKNGQQE